MNGGFRVIRKLLIGATFVALAIAASVYAGQIINSSSSITIAATTKRTDNTEIPVKNVTSNTGVAGKVYVDAGLISTGATYVGQSGYFGADDSAYITLKSKVGNLVLTVDSAHTAIPGSLTVRTNVDSLMLENLYLDITLADSAVVGADTSVFYKVHWKLKFWD